MSPVPSKFSQAANFIKHSNNLNSALKQPPLVKPTPVYQSSSHSPDLDTVPLKSNRRSKLDVALGGMSLLTGGIGLIGHFGKLLSQRPKSSDHTASPISHSTQVKEIIRLLQTGQFRCRHVFDFQWILQRIYMNDSVSFLKLWVFIWKFIFQI